MRLETYTEAQAFLQKARAALGPQLAGLSAVDLLLDNIPDLVSVREAQGLLAAVED